MDVASSTCKTDLKNTLLVAAGSVLVSLAALLHIYFFYLESVSWSKPSSWKTFGVRSAEDAETVRPWAFNQGFYNLFIAVGTLVGVTLIAVGGLTHVGIALALFGSLTMVGAATVLVLSNKRMARAAAIQGGAPLVGAILLAASLLM